MVNVAAFTVRAAVSLLPAKPGSSAKLATIPLANVPALIPDKLTPFSVARPFVLVVGQAGLPLTPHTGVPLSVKLTVLPLTPNVLSVLFVRVAERSTLPPYVDRKSTRLNSSHITI